MKTFYRGDRKKRQNLFKMFRKVTLFVIIIISNQEIINLLWRGKKKKSMFIFTLIPLIVKLKVLTCI